MKKTKFVTSVVIPTAYKINKKNEITSQPVLLPLMANQYKPVKIHIDINNR